MLASETGVASAAPGKPHVGRAEGVDPHRSRLQPLGEAVPATDVGSPHAGGKAVAGAVSEPDGVLIILEAQDGRDRTEYLLLGDAHVVFDLGEDRRIDEIARVAMADAAGGNPWPLLPPDPDTVEQ